MSKKDNVSNDSLYDDTGSNGVHYDAVNEFDDVISDQQLVKLRIDELCEHIKTLDYEIARHTHDKRNTINQLAGLLNHRDGQCSELGKRYKVTLKLGKNYRLNKKAYEGLSDLPERLNVVRDVVTQKVDTKKLNEILRVASNEDKAIVYQYIDESPAAPSATIDVRGRAND